jgi:hypothetical protein
LLVLSCRCFCSFKEKEEEQGRKTPLIQRAESAQNGMVQKLTRKERIERRIAKIQRRLAAKA